MQTIGKWFSQKNRKKPFSVSSNVPIFKALAALKKHDVGALLVVDGEEDKGIFTERDFARYCAGKGDKVDLSPAVSTAMTPNSKVKKVNHGTTLEEAAIIMDNGKFRHLPVVGAEGKIVAVFSIRSLLKALVADYHRVMDEIAGAIQNRS